MEATSRLVDLSHEVGDGVVTYPGLPAPVIDDHLSFDDSHGHYASGTEFRIGRIQMIANTGTYLDTPAHRYRGGFDLADLPLASVADLPGHLVDATGDGPAVEADAFTGLDVAGAAVLVRTGWDRHWGTERYGVGHPFLTAAAASLLVERSVALVGIDSVNIDDTSAERGERPVHSQLLAAGIAVLEHLCHLDQLAGEPFRVFAVPPKVRGLGTFPVRAFAIRN
jgi:kynurenine formamidase